MKDSLLGQVPELFIVVSNPLNTNLLYHYLAEKMEKFKLPKLIKIIPKISTRPKPSKLSRTAFWTRAESFAKKVNLSIKCCFSPINA